MNPQEWAEVVRMLDKMDLPTFPTDFNMTSRRNYVPVLVRLKDAEGNTALGRIDVKMIADSFRATEEKTDG